MEWTSIIVSVITGIFTVIGVIITNNKTKNLLEYRLNILEKKVDEQNKLKEEISEIKQSVALMSKDIEILKMR